LNIRQLTQRSLADIARKLNPLLTGCGKMQCLQRVLGNSHVKLTH